MHIFVSHAAEDENEVTALVYHLHLNLPGCTFFVSTIGGIKPGEEWWKSTERHLRGAVAVLVVLSSRSLDRPWLLFEGGAAWALHKPVIPVLIDGLAPWAIPSPLAAFQAVSAEGDAAALIARLSELTGIEQKLPSAPVLGLNHLGGDSERLLPGVHVTSRRYPLSAGWVRYSGTGELQVTRNYLDTGSSFDDGFRFPSSDRLGATGIALGVRMMSLQDVHFYAVCTLTSGRQIKVYASTTHQNWGFYGTPDDEFRVPLPMLRRGRWYVVVVRLRSFDRAFGGQVRSIDGFRVRGGMRISHIWCMPAPDTFSPIARRDEVKEIVWSAPG